MTHDFGEQLDFSHGLSDAPWWETVYRRAFGDMYRSMVDLRQDGWHQRAGRDRAIVLSTGRTLYVDEKGRREEWPDVLVEIWSQYPKKPKQRTYPRTPGAVEGWSRKPLDCDYLAYAFVPSEVCHLFPFLGVRSAVVKHGAAWSKEAASNFEARQNGGRAAGVQWVVAPNRSYDTVSLAVPVRRLWEAVADTLTVSWREDGGKPKQSSQQTQESTTGSWPVVRRPPDWEAA